MILDTNIVNEKTKKELKEKIVTQTSTLLSAAFVLVAGLAWNEAIKAWINQLLKPGTTAVALTVYAIAVTVIAVIIALVMNYIVKKVTDEKDKADT